MLFDAIKSLLGGHGDRASDAPAASGSGDDSSAEGGADVVDPVHLAACVLLLDVAYADGTFTDDERSHLETTMGRHFALPIESVRALIDAAEIERSRAIDHFQYTHVLRQNFDVGQKMVLAEVMWGLVLADGTVDEHEHYLTRKISNLLELEPGFLSTAKHRAAEQAREG
ncbi:MAG: TerB family tellurite resistance protein [Gemmatimonadota bacterium]